MLIRNAFENIVLKLDKMLVKHSILFENCFPPLQIQLIRQARETLTFELPEWNLEMAYLLISLRENNCLELFWNPSIRIAVMAQTNLDRAMHATSHAHMYTKVAIWPLIVSLTASGLNKESTHKASFDLSPAKINPFPEKPLFLRVCSTSLLKTLWEKEKVLVTSDFSFSHSISIRLENTSAIFITYEIDVCKLFQFGKV